MGSVIAGRRPATIKRGSLDVIPVTYTETSHQFPLPPTLMSDLERLYDTDHPNHRTCRLIKNWYEYDPEHGKGYVEIRVGQFQIQWKSAIGAADLKTQWRVARTVCDKLGIMPRRGDMCIYDGNEEKPGMLDWEVQEGPNDYNSQSIVCNTMFEFSRFEPEVTDEDGYLIHEARTKVIIPKIPGHCAEYTGRPDFEVLQGAPGITSKNLLTCYIQLNPVTDQLRIGDEFPIGPFTYHVENISYERIDINHKYGEIMFHARRSPGGGIN